MENSSRPMTSHPVHVTSHPALMHVGGMDLVGNYRASHGSGTVLFLPPAHVVCGKVMLSAVSVCQSVCRFTEVSHVTTTHDANGQLGAPPTCSNFFTWDPPPPYIYWQAGGWFSSSIFVLVIWHQNSNILLFCYEWRHPINRWGRYSFWNTNWMKWV